MIERFGLLDIVPYGLVILDDNFKVVDVNRIFLDFAQCNRQDVIGQNRQGTTTSCLDDLWQDAVAMRKQILTIYDQQDFIQSVEGQTAHEPKRWVEWRVQPISSGEYAEGWLEVYIDTTAMHKLKSDYAQAQEQISLLQDAQKRTLENQLNTTQSLLRLASPLPASKTAESYGQYSIRQSAPLAFDRLVTHYEQLLNFSVKKQMYKIDSKELPESTLPELAETLGQLHARPRDVVELHMKALQNQQDAGKTSPKRVYVEEGRMLLLELMGLLASYYRNHAMGFASAHPRGEEEKESR